jgi:hypothetical protein
MQKIIVIEYLKNGKTRSHEVTRQSFLRIVDKIRFKKHGWQLFRDGEVTTEKQAFGYSVCYGLCADGASTSFYNTF